jgi:hypothetical protein
VLLWLFRGTWRSEEFKEYNFNAMGLPTTGGHLHPLLKVNHGTTGGCTLGVRQYKCTGLL